MSHMCFGNNPEKIEKYRVFWSMAETRHPLVGFSLRGWFPMDEYGASRAWKSADYLTPEMVVPDAFLDDEERLLQEGEVICDDILRGACPCQAIPWLGGSLGSTLRILPGSILSAEQKLTWGELDHLTLQQDNPWFKKYIAFIETLVRRSAGRFPVSHGLLIVGPSDMAALLRGHEQSIWDLIDEPERTTALLNRFGDFFREITLKAWEHIPLFHGGYFDASYQLWAPGPLARMQEDATALYSPKLYREVLQPVDKRLAAYFPCSLMHLHSTSMFLLDAFLEIEEIKCFQINNDVGGPCIKEMIPHFQAVQMAKRPLLIRGSFTPDEIRQLADSLSPRGLYLYIMVHDIQEAETLQGVLGM